MRHAELESALRSWKPRVQTSNTYDAWSLQPESNRHFQGYNLACYHYKYGEIIGLAGFEPASRGSKPRMLGLCTIVLLETLPEIESESQDYKSSILTLNYRVTTIIKFF